jgi:hypothetical protein
MARTSYIQWNDGDVCLVLDQHAELDFYSASSLKQQSQSIIQFSINHICGVMVSMLASSAVDRGFEVR